MSRFTRVALIRSRFRVSRAAKVNRPAMVVAVTLIMYENISFETRFFCAMGAAKVPTVRMLKNWL